MTCSTAMLEISPQRGGSYQGTNATPIPRTVPRNRKVARATWAASVVPINGTVADTAAQ